MSNTSLMQCFLYISAMHFLRLRALSFFMKLTKCIRNIDIDIILLLFSKESSNPFHVWKKNSQCIHMNYTFTFIFWVETLSCWYVNSFLRTNYLPLSLIFIHILLYCSDTCRITSCLCHSGDSLLIYSVFVIQFLTKNIFCQLLVHI